MPYGPRHTCGEDRRKIPNTKYQIPNQTISFEDADMEKVGDAVCVFFLAVLVFGCVSIFSCFCVVCTFQINVVEFLLADFPDSSV